MQIKKDIERWFDHPEDPEKSRHLIRYIKPGEMSQIINKATKFESIYENQNGRKGLVPTIKSYSDPSKIQTEIFMSCLIGWEKMFDYDGTPLEFNDKNKMRAMTEIKGYLEWVNECHDRLDETLESENGILEKNSSTSVSNS